MTKTKNSDYYQKNKEKMKEYALQYYEEHKDEILKRIKAKKDDIQNYGREYYEQKKDHIRKKQNEKYQKKKEVLKKTVEERKEYQISKHKADIEKVYYDKDRYYVECKCGGICSLAFFDTHKKCFNHKIYEKQKRSSIF
jgi:hypothetical protein